MVKWCPDSYDKRLQWTRDLPRGGAQAETWRLSKSVHEGGRERVTCTDLARVCSGWERLKQTRDWSGVELRK